MRRIKQPITPLGPSPRIVLTRLHPNFSTWKDTFDHVRTVGPLPIQLPYSGGKTMVEFNLFMDEIQKAKLQLVSLCPEPGPGEIVLCTAKQAGEIQALLDAAAIKTTA